MSEDSRNKITVFEDGWYDCSRFDTKLITTEPIPNNDQLPPQTYTELSTAYYFPHLVYSLSDGQKKTQYFTTEQQLRTEIVHLRTQIKLHTLINF